MEYNARIIEIKQETPSVKSFVFDLQGKEMDFLPGQWIDLFIETDTETLVGGYTLASSPRQKDRIQLAIKKPPFGKAGIYMHEVARVGDELLIAGPSGEFFYQPEMGKALVLVAGGIGITPLMSMIRFIGQAKLDVNVTLIYSAETPDEFVFYDELKAMSARNPNIRCVFTVTGPVNKPWTGPSGRIDAKMLSANITDPDTLFYLCGPAGMAEAIRDILRGLGIAESRILAERW